MKSKTIYTFFAGLLAGGLIGWMARGAKKAGNVVKIRKIGLRGKRKEERKEKILEYLKTHEKISNDKVEEMFGVSHNTAERYLDQLEKEGFLKQIGRTGRSVYYTKNN